METTPHLSEFILYSALDVIDEKRKTSNAQWDGCSAASRFRYLGVIDKSNGYLVSASLTPGNILCVWSLHTR